VAHRLGIAALVAFIILDIFLIPRALDRGRAGPEEIRPQVSESTATTPETGAADPEEVVASPSPTQTPATAPTDEAVNSALSDGPTLMALDGDLVVQAERGGCNNDEPADLAISTDGAKTFDRVELDQLVAVLAVAVADGVIEVTGASSDCELVTLASGDGGQSWGPTEAGAGWRLVGDPAEDAVESPDGRIETPCRPVALSSEGDAVVRVLCEDGKLLGYDGGASWAALGDLSGATAVRYPTPARAFAIAPGEDCPAAVFGTRDGGADWSELACLDGADGPGAVAGRDGHYVARAGAVSLVSTDSGATWVRPGS
jgi:hypothetical protein